MNRLLIDYGASGCRYIIETSDGEIFGEFAPANQELEAFICTQLDANPLLQAVHIAYAGQIIKGNISSAPNIKVNHQSLKASIQSQYNIAVKIENDLKCAALAEFHARKNSVSLFAAYIGTGFGGALVEEGRLLRGNSNMAGEIGHIPFRKAPFHCGCGKDDCVELYGSGSALARWVDYYGLGCEPTLEAIKSSTDERAAYILENFYDAVSHAVSTAVTLFNPTYVILGGGVVQNNPYLESVIRKNVNDMAFMPSAKEVKIETSAFKYGCLEGTKWL